MQPGYQDRSRIHEKIEYSVVSITIPGAIQAFASFDGNGANQRIFRKFIESSYGTLEPVKQEREKREPVKQ